MIDPTDPVPVAVRTRERGLGQVLGGLSLTGQRKREAQQLLSARRHVLLELHLGPGRPLPTQNILANPVTVKTRRTPDPLHRTIKIEPFPTLA
jgi:hypothetical protein